MPQPPHSSVSEAVYLAATHCYIRALILIILTQQYTAEYVKLLAEAERGLEFPVGITADMRHRDRNLYLQGWVRPSQATTCVSSYLDVCVLILICVLILVYVCPHTSSDSMRTHQSPHLQS